MSNVDRRVAGSQSLAAQAFQSELAAAQAAGNVELAAYWMRFITGNVSNRLYVRP